MPALQVVHEDEEEKEAGRRETVVKKPPLQPEQPVNEE